MIRFRINLWEVQSSVMTCRRKRMDLSGETKTYGESKMVTTDGADSFVWHR